MRHAQRLMFFCEVSTTMDVEKLRALAIARATACR